MACEFIVQSRKAFADCTVQLDAVFVRFDEIVRHSFALQHAQELLEIRVARVPLEATVRVCKGHMLVLP